ncbi:MAG: YdeI/OmpD-associated family protein [Opitutae bacterium]|nr:YdeI/OmpD-associated family protein [Opitutae bacterium]
MTPRFFKSAADFRAWLEKNHATATELWVGLYKKHVPNPGLTYPDAVIEALCFGWIDSVMRRIDDDRHMQRFTPRKPGSVWSNINVAHVERLTREGRMAPAGLAAFAVRSAAKTGIYSFEREKPAELPPAYLREFKAHAVAWKFFQAQPPGYRRLALHHVVNPKQEATRRRWLEKLIAASAAGRRID